MNDNHFDEFFRDKLGKFASNVPGDMWQRINKKDNDRKGFIIPRWYWLALLLFFIGVGGYFVLNNNINKESGNDDVVKTEKLFNEKDDTDKRLDEKENKNGDSAFVKVDNNKSTTSVNRNISNTSKNKILPQQTIADKQTNSISNSISSINSSTKNFEDNSVGVVANNDQHSDTIKRISLSKNKISDSSVIANNTNDEEKKEDAESNDKFFLELYASPEMPINSISSDNARYEQTLKDAGKMRLSYSFGAKIGFRINKNWAAKIGVQYEQLNQKVNFVDSILTGTNVFYNNRYKSIDIPMLLSYRKQWSTVFSSSFDAGILLNISSKYKGAIPDPFGDTRHIDNSNVYKTGTGVSIFVGADLSKKLNNKLDVFVEPYFRYRLKSITTNLEPFTQKIHAAGISLGVRYRLFKQADED